MSYAAKTIVSTEKTRAEIERLLQRYGADQFLTGWDATRAMLSFRMRGRQFRLQVPLPDRQAEEFTSYRGPYGDIRSRTREVAQQRWEQACRSRWRALKLMIQASLEAIEIGAVSPDEAFLAWTVLPDSTTVGEFMVPQVERSYSTGLMPPLLPGLPDPEGVDR